MLTVRQRDAVNIKSQRYFWNGLFCCWSVALNRGSSSLIIPQRRVCRHVSANKSVTASSFGAKLNTSSFIRAADLEYNWEYRQRGSAELMCSTPASNRVINVISVYSFALKLLLQDPFALSEVNAPSKPRGHNSALLGQRKIRVIRHLFII